MAIKRTKALHLKLDEQEKELFARAATAVGLSLSAWIRFTLRNHPLVAQRINADGDKTDKEAA